MSSYWIFFKWHVWRIKRWIGVLLAFQVAIGLGGAYGLRFLLPVVTPPVARFLVTGGATAIILGMGLAILPAIVSRAKEDGTHEYLATLPRSTFACIITELTLWTAIVMPSVVLVLFVGSRLYGASLTVSPWAPAVLALVAVSSTAIGYFYAVASPSLVVTNAISNLILVSIFLLTPVFFPAYRLPRWLQTVHHFLPFEYAAKLVRTSFIGSAEANIRGGMVVALWGAAGLALAVMFLKRRK